MDWKRFGWLFGALILVTKSGWALETEQSYPEEFSIKEAVLRERVQLQRYKKDLVEKEIPFGTFELSAGNAPQRAALLHFRIEKNSSSLKVEQLRFRVDQSRWLTLPVIDQDLYWHSFAVGLANLGQRHLDLEVEALFERKLRPFHLGEIFLTGSAFVPLLIGVDKKEYDIDLQLKSRGFFDPVLNFEAVEIGI